MEGFEKPPAQVEPAESCADLSEVQCSICARPIRTATGSQLARCMEVSTNSKVHLLTTPADLVIKSCRISSP